MKLRSDEKSYLKINLEKSYLKINLEKSYLSHA